jgi:hypothetical protein
LGGSTEASEEAAEPKKKEPTKKYLNSTYPAVDTTLMFHVVLQVLIEVGLYYQFNFCHKFTFFPACRTRQEAWALERRGSIFVR